MVVSIEGIISERDLAYGLATHASNLPYVLVSELMTKQVITCSSRDSVSEIAKVMTQRRVRHLPVKDGDQLVGIITIGDVLKHRLDEMQLGRTCFAIMPLRGARVEGCPIGLGRHAGIPASSRMLA